MPENGELIVHMPVATQPDAAWVQQTVQRVEPLYKVVVRQGCILLYLQGPGVGEEEEKQLLRNIVGAVTDGYAPGASLTSKDGRRLCTLLPDGDIKVTYADTVPAISSANLVYVQSSQSQQAATGSLNGSTNVPAPQRQLQVELPSVSPGDRIRLHVEGDICTVTLPATRLGMNLHDGCSTKLFYSVPDHIQTIQYVERVAASGRTSGRVPVTDMSTR